MPRAPLFGLFFFVLFIGLLASAAQANTPPQFQFRLYPPASFDTHRLGAEGAGHIGFSIILLNGNQTGALQGPFTVRTTLPEGVSFIGHQGSNWSCSASGQDVSCDYSSFLSAAVWSSAYLRVHVNVAGDIPVPGQSQLQATLEHAVAPLPEPLVCGGTLQANYVISLTQCAQWDVPHRSSQTIFVPAAWAHSNQPMLVGATNQTISAGFDNLGFDAMHGTITARFLIPPGLLRTGVTGQVVWTCSDQDAGSAGTVVTCTTPSFFDGMNPQTSRINLRFTVTDQVDVPGPLTIIGTIGHAYQPWPEDFSECLQTEPPIGCSVYGGIVTAEPPRARMQYTEFSHAPAVLRPGQAGSVLARYTNVGDGNAGELQMRFAAPPGFSFTGATDMVPTASCAATGDPASGQLIECSAGSGFPVNGQGQIRLHFGVAWAGALELPLTANIGDSTRAAPELPICLDDPALSGCGQHLIPVLDSLFCDRFEQPGAGCRVLP